MPTVSILTPEAGMPHGYFFLDRPKHQYDQPHCGNLRQNTEHYSQAARNLRRPEKHRETLAHSNFFASFGRASHVTPAARNENDACHYPQEKNSDILIAQQLGNHRAFLSQLWNDNLPFSAKYTLSLSSIARVKLQSARGS